MQTKGESKMNNEQEKSKQVLSEEQAKNKHSLSKKLKLLYIFVPIIIIALVLAIVLAINFTKNSCQGRLIWKYKTGGNVFTLPAIYNDKIYAGSWDYYIYCLNEKNGALVWKYKTGGEVNSALLVYANKVYVGSDDGFMYCLNAETGQLEWKYKTGKDVRTSPTLTDGKVYFNSNDGYVYCLNANTGKLVWKYNTKSKYQGAPAVYDKRLYVSAGKFYCLDADTGNEIWDYNAACTTAFFIRPAIYAGKVYFCGVVYLNNRSNWYVYCLNINDSSVKWSSRTIDSASFQYISEGRFFAETDSLENGVFNSWLYCFDLENGDVINKQNFCARSPLYSKIVDDSLYFESCSNFICSLSATDGKISQKFQIESEIGPILVENGRMYFGSGFEDNSIYCVDLNE